MKQHWLLDLCNIIATQKIAVRVSVIRTEGSAPNSVGSGMTVSTEGFVGTIGGGALEFEALLEARKLLKEFRVKQVLSWHRVTREYQLGPTLGQCCGGFVRLLFEPFGAAELKEIKKLEDGRKVSVRPLAAGSPWQFSVDCKEENSGWPAPVRKHIRALHAGERPWRPALIGSWYIEPHEPERQELFLYGAGHVGRAVVKVLQDLPFKIYWVDTDRARFPDTVPEDIKILIAVDPAGITRYAPRGAWHIVMTYSHRIDFNICHEALKKGNSRYVGVIASKTKRARFITQLQKSGISASSVKRLVAPIGLPSIEGKEPATIAVSVAADLLIRLQKKTIKGESTVRERSKEAV